jgi:hypothetical protein
MCRGNLPLASHQIYVGTSQLENQDRARTADVISDARLFNRCRKYNNAHSWELYRETQRRYRKEVRKASKETWRTFCNSVNDLPKAARLHRALSKDPVVRLGSLVAPSGSPT